MKHEYEQAYVQEHVSVDIPGQIHHIDERLGIPNATSATKLMSIWDFCALMPRDA